MKKLAVFLLVLASAAFTTAAPTTAEEAARTPEAAKPAEPEKTEPASAGKKSSAAKADKPEPEAAATPAKKPGVLSRIFARRPMTISKPEKKEKDPETAASPTPRGKSKPTPEPKATPAAKPEPKPTPDPKAKPLTSPSPRPTPKPKRPKATPEPKAETPPDTAPAAPAEPAKPAPEKEAAPVPGTPDVPDSTPAPAASTKSEVSPVESDARERDRFNAARSKALQDPSIQALKNKAELAEGDDEQRKASKEFYKGLYKKMRALDGSLKDRIDRMEAAILRRVDAPGEK